MTDGTPKASSMPQDSALWGIGWLIASLALLAGEYLAVSYLYDARPLLEHGGWQGALGHVGSIAPLGGVVLTATFVAGGRPMLARLRTALATPEPLSRKATWLGLNLVAFAALLWSLDQLHASLGSGVDVSGLTVLFLGSALATGLFGLALTLSPDRWARLARDLRRPLLLGLAAGILAWLAGWVSAKLWYGLSRYTLETVAALIAPFTNSLVYVPEEAIVGTETFFVIIAPVCSGYEGIGLITVFVGLYLWVARDALRFPNAWVLLPLSVLAVWLGNALRIALLVAVGVNISPTVALGGFHSKAGWLFFCAIALATVAVAQRWKVVAKAPHERAQAEELIQHDNPTAAYLMPLLTLIGTKLATGLFVDRFDYLYPLSFVTVAIVLFAYRKQLPRPRWTPSWHAPLIGVAVYPLWLWTYPALDPDAGPHLHASVVALGTPLGTAWLIFRVLGSCVTVPIAEELAFRGFLLRRLIDVEFTEVDLRRLTPLALIGSSLAFGLLHNAYLGGTLAGLAYALAQWSRGRMGDAIVAHAVTNGLIAIDVLVRGHYFLWA